MMMLRNASLEILQQLKTLINDVGEYYADEPADGSSSIGRHVRHMLDHFDAIRLATDSGHVNYNSRSRNSIIELEPKAALNQIGRLVQWLKAEELENRALSIESEVSVNQCQNITVDGNLHREICYVINHTVHHIAYATLIAKQLGLTVDASLGVAPATATHMRNAVLAFT